MQLKLTNQGAATVQVEWDVPSLPPNTHSIQFRSVSNVTAEGQAQGFDELKVTDSPKLGKTTLGQTPLIKSGLLLQVSAAARDQNFQDIEGSVIAAIVPL